MVVFNPGLKILCLGFHLLLFCLHLKLLNCLFWIPSFILFMLYIGRHAMKIDQSLNILNIQLASGQCQNQLSFIDIG